MKKIYLLLFLSLFFAAWIFWPRVLNVGYFGPLSGPDVEEGSEFYRGLREALVKKGVLSPEIDFRVLDSHLGRRTLKEDLRKMTRSEDLDFVFGNSSGPAELLQILEEGPVSFVLSQETHPSATEMAQVAEMFLKEKSSVNKATVLVSRASPNYAQASELIFKNWALENSMEVYEIDRGMKVLEKLRDKARRVIVLAPGAEARKIERKLKGKGHTGAVFMLKSAGPYERGFFMGEKFIQSMSFFDHLLFYSTLELR